MKKNFFNFQIILAIFGLNYFLLCPGMAVNWDFEVDRDKRTLDIYPPGAYPNHKGPTGLYRNPVLSRLPKAPLLQDYIRDVHAHLHPQIPISIHIPASHISLLPADIRAKITEDNVSPASVKIFVVGQRLPRNSDDLTPSFYPHYGTDPLAPTEGNYNAWRTVDLLLTGSDSQQVRFSVIQPENGVRVINEQDRDGRIKKSAVRNKPSIVHPGNPDPVTHRCPQVVSPVPIGITGLDQRGESFWSYVKYTEGGTSKGIATLHLLFSRDQLDKIYNELWGEGDNRESNFGRLATGIHTRNNAEFLTLIRKLQQTPEFNNHGRHFQRLNELLEYQPVGVPQVRRPAIPQAKKRIVRLVAAPQSKKAVDRSVVVPQVRKLAIPTRVKARRAIPSGKSLQKPTKRSVKVLKRKRNLQKKKLHHSRKRKQNLLRMKRAKERVYSRKKA